jgi:hypothetical protein
MDQYLGKGCGEPELHKTRDPVVEMEMRRLD